MKSKPEMDRIADELFRCIVEADSVAFAELISTDFVLWHNTTQEEIAYDRIFEHFAQISAGRTLAYSDIKRNVTDEGFISQHIVSVTKPDGATYRVPLCLIVTIRDGKIVRANEWLDSAQAAQQ